MTPIMRKILGKKGALLLLTRFSFIGDVGENYVEDSYVGDSYVEDSYVGDSYVDDFVVDDIFCSVGDAIANKRCGW